MKPDDAHSLFISDLHLTPEQPAAGALFFRFLRTTARSAQALYILGDLFEAWVGDDDLPSPFPASVVQALRELADAGVAIFVMHGNRDFLLGPAFCQAAGAHLLPDPSIIDLHGSKTLLMHGDSLCTDDAAYQQFRALVRGPAWQRQFLGRSLPERRDLVAQLREQSEMAKDGKTMASMDVNQQAVASAFRQAVCSRLIHGHTHRPARHLHQIDGEACERWVLPDWYTAGGYLRCDALGCRAVELG